MSGMCLVCQISCPARSSHHRSICAVTTHPSANVTTYRMRVAKTSNPRVTRAPAAGAVDSARSELKLERSVLDGAEAEPRVVRVNHPRWAEHPFEASVAQEVTAAPDELTGGEVSEPGGHVVQN